MNDDSTAGQRILRDLAALLALPAIWLGHEPQTIAADLTKVLVSILNLKSAFVCFVDPTGNPPMVYWHPDQPSPPSEFRGVPGEVRPMDQGGHYQMPGESVRVASLSSELPGEFGHILVAADRPDFPTERELHLLRVAVGQAAVAVRVARMVEIERAGRLSAEAELARRDALTSELAKEMHIMFPSLLSRIDELLSAEARQHPEVSHSLPQQEPLTHNLPTLPALHLAGSLTRRETEVLGLLAQGLSNKQIAEELWVSDRTVERHITGLYRKMGVHSRTEAVTLVLRHTGSDDELRDIPH